MSKENKNETGKMLSEQMAKEANPQTSERKIPDDFVLVKGDEKLGIDDFYICKHEVTVQEFIDLVGVSPYTKKIYENHPVTSVSFLDAMYYCNKRSLQEGFEPVYMYGKSKQTNPEKWGYKPCLKKNTTTSFAKNEEANGYRLPLDIEWDYAARAGENYKYSGSDNLEEVAWNGCFKKLSGVHAVMQKKPNAFGLYDMTGNVNEWCERRKKYEDEIIHFYPCKGGSYESSKYESVYELDNQLEAKPLEETSPSLGFRLVLNAGENKEKSVVVQEFDKLNNSLNTDNNPGEDFVLIKSDKTIYKSLKPFYLCKHRVTQRDFYDVMGFTSYVYNINTPYVMKAIALAECKLINAIMYCNKRSLIEGLEPYYIFKGTNDTNPDNWNIKKESDYIGYFSYGKISEIKLNKNADGYRLLSNKEIFYIRDTGKRLANQDVSSQSEALCKSIVKGNVWEHIFDEDEKFYIYRGINIKQGYDGPYSFRVVRSFF